MPFKTRRDFLKAAGIGALAGVSGCTGLGGGNGSDAITVGFNAPLSGFASADGQSVRHGAELAQEIINEDGGVNGRDIDLVIRDDEAQADNAVPAAQSLINEEEVDIGVSGSYSTPTRAVAPIYEENETPFISAYATHPDITDGDYTFRVGMLATLQGRAQAKIAADELNADTCAVLTLDNDYGQVVSNAFQEAAANEFGIDMDYKTTYPLGEDDFRPVLSEIEDIDPDILMSTAYYNEASSLVKQVEEMNIDVQVLGSEGYDSPKFFELGGPGAEGTIIVTPCGRDTGLEANQEFLERYPEKYDTIADAVAAMGHDAIKLVEKSITDAGGTDPDDVRSAIANLEDWEGAASGPIREFVGSGEAVRPIPAVQASGGDWERYAIVEDEDLIYPDV